MSELNAFSRTVSGGWTYIDRIHGVTKEYATVNELPTENVLVGSPGTVRRWETHVGCQPIFPCWFTTFISRVLRPAHRTSDFQWDTLRRDSRKVIRSGLLFI